jgi:hypothetical protein
MTRREPPASPPEPDYQAVVRLGTRVKCCACERWLEAHTVVLMTRFGYCHPTCLDGAA